MGIWNALAEGWRHGKGTSERVQKAQEYLKDVKEGESKSLYTYEWLKGGNMTYHQATILKKYPSGVRIAKGAWVTSKRYAPFDKELDVDLRYDFGLKPSAEPYVRSQGMGVVSRDSFIPYAKMRGQKEYIPEP